jgi:hypothetical protein
MKNTLLLNQPRRFVLSKNHAYWLNFFELFSSLLLRYRYSYARILVLAILFMTWRPNLKLIQLKLSHLD